jgi:hypothetical protein
MKAIIISVLFASLVACGGASSLDDSSPVVNSNPVGSGNPKCITNLTLQNPNAWIQHSPQVHFVYWGNYPFDDANQYQQDWSNLLAFPTTFLDRLAEYGVQTGSFDNQAYWTQNPITLPLDTKSAPGYTLIDDNAISSEINNEIAADLLPLPNDNTVFMIMLPPNYLTHNNYFYHSGGYHGNTVYSGQRYVWSIITYQSFHYYGNTLISHELAEGATDPNYGQGWMVSNGEEVADLCEAYASVPFDGIYISQYWNDDDCQCQ